MSNNAITPLNERELENDYPMHPTYLYVVNNRVWRCPHFITVGELKRKMPNFTSVKNCDIKGRDLWNQMS